MDIIPQALAEYFDYNDLQQENIANNQAPSDIGLNNVSYKTLKQVAFKKLTFLKQKNKIYANYDNVIGNTILQCHRALNDIQQILETEHLLEQAILTIESDEENLSLIEYNTINALTHLTTTDNSALTVQGNKLCYNGYEVHRFPNKGFYYHQNGQRTPLSRQTIKYMLVQQLTNLQNSVFSTNKQYNLYCEELINFLKTSIQPKDNKQLSIDMLMAFNSSYEEDVEFFRQLYSIIEGKPHSEEMFSSPSEGEIRSIKERYSTVFKNSEKSQDEQDERDYLYKKICYLCSFMEAKILAIKDGNIKQYKIAQEEAMNNKNDALAKKYEDLIKQADDCITIGLRQQFQSLKDILDKIFERNYDYGENEKNCKEQAVQQLQKTIKISTDIQTKLSKGFDYFMTLKKSKNSQTIVQNKLNKIMDIDEIYSSLKSEMYKNQGLLAEIKKLGSEQAYLTSIYTQKIKNLEDQLQELNNENIELAKHINSVKKLQNQNLQLTGLNQEIIKQKNKLQIINEQLKEEINEIKSSSLQHKSDTAFNTGITTTAIGVTSTVSGSVVLSEVSKPFATALGTTLIALGVVLIIVAIVAFAIYYSTKKEREDLISLTNKNKQNRIQNYNNNKIAINNSVNEVPSQKQININ